MNGVSAVLITKNEAKFIGRCIKSLEGLDEEATCASYRAVY